MSFRILISLNTICALSTFGLRTRKLEFSIECEAASKLAKIGRMDFRTAIKNQTHAALAMLAECVEDCPPSLWLSGGHPRPYWKIAYHVAAFSQCFMSPTFESWEKWEHHRREATWTFSDDSFAIPVIEPYTPEQVLDYIRLIQGQVDELIDVLDLDEDTCGIPWYENLPRAELLILNVRHISEHVGQLHELRLAAGLDVDWRATREYLPS